MNYTLYLLMAKNDFVTGKRSACLSDSPMETHVNY